MFAICRVNKLKSSDLGKAGAHNDRTMSVPNANPDVKNDESWTRYNKEKHLSQQVYSRLNELGIEKHRTDAVVAIEILLTASPEYFRPENPSEYGLYEPEAVEKWKKLTEAFLLEKYGDNLVKMTVHLDEATPHMHAIIVPAVEKTKSKRRTKQQINDKVQAETYTECTLDAKTIFNKFALINLQTDYAASVKELGLERGMRSSKAVHQAVKNYYAIVNSEPQRTFKPTDFLDPNVFKDLDIPVFGKDEFFKNLYKTVIKKVEKNISKILNKYVKQITALKIELKSEKDRTKWVSDKFGSPEYAQQAYDKLEEKIKSVCQEKDKAEARESKLGYLLQTTQVDALREATELKQQLSDATSRLNAFEAAKRDLERSNSIMKGKSPFKKTSNDDLEI
jgi:hypothetical protein